MPEVRHPGGRDMTERLLTLAGIRKPVQGKAADLGAGSGVSVEVLSEYGYQAEGFDLKACGAVRETDFLNMPAADESYDLVLSECAFWLSGNQKEAVREAARIVKQGGRILIADVFSMSEAEIRAMAEDLGLKLLFLEDQTACWKEYIIERLWQDEYLSEVCMNHKRSRYYLLGLERI